MRRYAKSFSGAKKCIEYKFPNPLQWVDGGNELDTRPRKGVSDMPRKRLPAGGSPHHVNLYASDHHQKSHF